MLPQWKNAKWWIIVQKMQLVETIPKGEQVFTAPPTKVGEARRELSRTPWPMCIFWDPPAEYTPPEQPDEDPRVETDHLDGSQHKSWRRGDRGWRPDRASSGHKRPQP